MYSLTSEQTDALWIAGVVVPYVALTCAAVVSAARERGRRRLERAQREKLRNLLLTRGRFANIEQKITQVLKSHRHGEDN